MAVMLDRGHCLLDESILLFLGAGFGFLAVRTTIVSAVTDGVLAVATANTARASAGVDLGVLLLLLGTELPAQFP